MRFLFVTIQGFESDFYARVGSGLTRRGCEVEHLTYSRRAARKLRERGLSARALLELRTSEAADLAGEVRRIERRYGLPTIRDVYRTDRPCLGRSEDWCLRRTVSHFRAIEALIDELEPDVLVPEVGTEMIRTVAHLVALDRKVPTLFLSYTIFPKPLRLVVDSLQAPIVTPSELRPLAADERTEVERFVAEFTARARPIREPRGLLPSRARLRRLAGYTAARLGEDRDNDYLRPGRWAVEYLQAWGRVLAARPLRSSPEASRRFVYFPLHLAEDYKIARVVPEFADQASIAELVADALPLGYDLVVKEHPLSIGRNPLPFLRRLTRRPNVRLVGPQTSSHDLIGRAAGVAVISSTVGLEALLYRKPVLTLGRPFYAGYGLTLDVSSLADLRTQIPALLDFRPDGEQILRFLHAAMRSCSAGSPVLVDRSDANAEVLAASLDSAAAGLAHVPDDRVLADVAARA